MGHKHRHNPMPRPRRSGEISYTADWQSHWCACATHRKIITAFSSPKQFKAFSSFWFLSSQNIIPFPPLISWPSSLWTKIKGENSRCHSLSDNFTIWIFTRGCWNRIPQHLWGPALAVWWSGVWWNRNDWLFPHFVSMDIYWALPERTLLVCREIGYNEPKTVPWSLEVISILGKK